MNSKTNELLKWKELLEKGFIDRDFFEKKKKEILKVEEENTKIPEDEKQTEQSSQKSNLNSNVNNNKQKKEEQKSQEKLNYNKTHTESKIQEKSDTGSNFIVPELAS